MMRRDKQELLLVSCFWFGLLGLLYYYLIKLQISFTTPKVVLRIKNPQFGIVMMIHDDDDILPYWLRYHSKILSLNNIVVLDNFSGSKTLQILKEWEDKGLRVLYDQGPYSLKGNLTLTAFRSHLPYVDVAIPLDSDEFLVAFDGSKPIINADAILEKLEEFYYLKASCWGLQQYYTSLNFDMNDTISTIRYFHPAIYPLQIAKKIIRMNVLVELDHGSHHPRLSRGNCVSAINEFGLLHYHHRSPFLTVQRALNDVIGFGYLPDNVIVQNLSRFQDNLQDLTSTHPQGEHKIRQLLQFIQFGYSGLLQHVPLELTYNLENIETLIENLTRERVMGK